MRTNRSSPLGRGHPDHHRRRRLAVTFIQLKLKDIEVRGHGRVEPEASRLHLVRPAPRDWHGDPHLGGRVEDKVMELTVVGGKPVAAAEDEAIAAVHQDEAPPLAVGQEGEGGVDGRRACPGDVAEAVATRAAAGVGVEG